MTNDIAVSKKFPISQWITWFLISIGLGWIFWLIFQQWDTLAKQFVNVKIESVIFILILGFISTLHNAFVFHLLLNKHIEKKISFIYAARLLFVGQMIRHVPGRFWGVVYQINETKSHIPATSMIRINIDFMFISLAFAILIPLVVLLFFIDLWLAIFTFLLAILIIIFSLRYDWNNRILRLVSVYLPKRMADHLCKMTSTTPYSWTHIIKLIIFSSSGWLFYFLAWQFFALAWPIFADTNILILCATYSIAWIIGFISLVTPSGLGVREAMFLLLSPSGHASSLALLAILVRFWLLINDILLFILFLVLPIRKKYV